MRAKCLAMIVGMLMSTMASAAMVDVTFDVTLTERSVGQLDGAGGWDTVVDAGFIPKTFSLTVRFDADSSHIAETYVDRNPFTSTVSREFSSPSLSSSPYSQPFRNAVSGLTVSPDVSSVRFVDESSTGDFTQDGFSASNYANYLVMAGVSSIYNQNLWIDLYQGPGSRDDIDPLADNDLLNLLQSTIGHTNVGGYQEYYALITSETPLGEWGTVIGYNVLAVDAQFLTGDITVRSVQAVPLPAIGLWMQLSAAGAIAWVSRRRQLRGRV